MDPPPPLTPPLLLPMMMMATCSCPCPPSWHPGAVMSIVAYTSAGLRPVQFRPCHRNKLGNEFRLYCDRDPLTAELGGFDLDLDSSSDDA